MVWLSAGLGSLSVDATGPTGTTYDDSVSSDRARSANPRIPTVWLVVASIASVQIGAAIAKNLFAEVGPTAMVWLRLATSALVLMLIARPRLRGHSRTDWLLLVGYGASLAGMNWAIYQSFARIPLGLAVTIEFLGPLAVAVVGSRRLFDLLWAGLALLGVALLGFSPVRPDLLGVALALLAGACWAGYITLGSKVGRRFDGLSSLAMASVLGVVILGPFAIGGQGAVLLRPEVLLVGALVGVLSSVIPYSLELTALRTMPPRVFGILMSLEPAAAALAALAILHETLGWIEIAAMACVVIASVGATRSGRPLDPEAPVRAA